MRWPLQFLTGALLLAMLGAIAAHTPNAGADDATGGRRVRNSGRRIAADPHARDPLLTQSRQGRQARLEALARQAWFRQASLNLQRERDRQAAAAGEAWYRQAALSHEAALHRQRELDRQAAAAGEAWYRQAARNVQAPAPATPVSPTVPAPVPAPAPNPGPVSAEGHVVSVRGIVVDAGIASNLQALLSQADAAGIALSGSGYRDPAAQRRLREQHCPDPINSPPSACSPATARPGESMHEKGVAIDFTSGGSLISSRANAAFRWLEANAARFGFFNLPSEPWHWSVNGQ